MSSKRADSAATNSQAPPKAVTPWTYKLFFIGFFLLCETALIGIDLFYLLAQNGTAWGFFSDVLLESVIIVFLTLFAYFMVRRIIKGLLRSEKQFHELADSLPQAIFESDVAGQVVYANKVALSWIGLSRQEAADGSVNIIEMLIPEDRERARADMTALIGGFMDTPQTFSVQKADGSVIPVIISTTPIKSAGKIVGLRGVVTDIREQKKVEQLIRESEKKYRELAESLPEVVFEMDTAGNITYVNASGLATFGYGEETLAEGLNVRDVMFDPDAAAAAIELMVSSRTQAVSREYTAHRADGTRVPVVISARLMMEDGVPVGVRGVATDVSDINHAHQMIQISEEKYRNLFESSLDGIEVVSFETGKIIEANQAALEIFGYTLDELQEQGYTDLTPESWFLIEAAIFRDQLNVRGYTDEYEKEIIRKDGKLVPISMRRWLIRDESGEPVAMWNILRDITEKKMRERELERVNAELRGYAHTVSHDLKNPIHEVSFSAHTLDMLMDRPDTEENRQYISDVLEIMKKGLDRANRLIDNILALAESGQVPHDVRPVDVSEKIDEVLEERSVEMEVRGIRVLKDSDLGVVMASPTHIYQLFSNLIKNAFEYCDSDSPIIEVRALDKANGEHRYLVRDNGSGIPADLIERIFIPFSRGSSGQTGIGLSIVDRITRVYASDVKAYNDSGACFEFSLRDYE